VHSPRERAEGEEGKGKGRGRGREGEEGEGKGKWERGEERYDFNACTANKAPTLMIQSKGASILWSRDAASKNVGPRIFWF
jgi:hypothetical protein